MYKHHEESIQKLIEYFKDMDGLISIILGGSVAKGLERVDSDIDAMIVVTDKKFEELISQNRETETVKGHCTYEEGYFDIKYMTLSYMETAARKGSEPTRNAFVKSRVIWGDNPDVLKYVEEIPVFQKSEKEEKLFSFYAALKLSSGYLWNSSKDIPYLRVRSAADTVLFGLRLILQENEILFPCHKSLFIALSRAERKPKDIDKIANQFLTDLTQESRDLFVNTVLDFIDYVPPENHAKVLSRFVLDSEKWWFYDRPNFYEW